MSVTRRAFCAGCCLAAAGAALAGDAPAPGTGPVTTRDTRAGLKAGAVQDYRKEGRFFLMADDRGVYAVTAVCTHHGCTVAYEPPAVLACPCHGSEYDLQGGNILGPAVLPLRHLAVREPAPGAPLVVDTATTVDAGFRL